MNGSYLSFPFVLLPLATPLPFAPRPAPLQSTFVFLSPLFSLLFILFSCLCLLTSFMFFSSCPSPLFFLLPTFFSLSLTLYLITFPTPPLLSLSCISPTLFFQRSSLSPSTLFCSNTFIYSVLSRATPPLL